MVRRVKKYQARKWGEDCWARLFSWFRETNLQGMQEGQTEREQMMRQPQRMKLIKDKENQIEGKNGCEQQLVGQ